jgi:hypothetical protein
MKGISYICYAAINNKMVTIIKKGASKSSIKQLLQKIQVKKGIEAYKYCGVIKLKQHPLVIQKLVRDEWS